MLSTLLRLCCTVLSCCCPAAKYDNEAGHFWELFYRRNADKFFKDRHYFDKEWPQLLEGPLTVLEVRQFERVLCALNPNQQCVCMLGK
jgi:hypothetical protein